jgi:hypothetical protein
MDALSGCALCSDGCKPFSQNRKEVLCTCLETVKIKLVSFEELPKFLELPKV